MSSITHNYIAGCALSMPSPVDRLHQTCCLNLYTCQSIPPMTLVAIIPGGICVREGEGGGGGWGVRGVDVSVAVT